MSKKNKFRRTQDEQTNELSDNTEEKSEAQTSESTELEPSTIEPPTGAEADEVEAVPANNFAEAAAGLEAIGVEPVAPVDPVVAATRGVLPDAFGNNKKGERICSVCGIKESETLAKNPRYSFCKGKCVNCYGKTERKTVKPAEMTEEQIKSKIAYYQDLLTKKLGAQGLPDGSAVENTNVATAEGTIETSGANLDAKADELAAVASE
jgi:hypothetical protein